MLLPQPYAWFEPVLIASIVVFVVDLVGNSITFSNRYLSALVSAAIFAIIFGALGRCCIIQLTPVGLREAGFEPARAG